MNERLVITCEHGGNRVPAEYARLFRGHRDVLDSHRGHDPGSLPLAKAFAERFHAPLFSSETTRLLVELNRSPGRRSLFSEFTAPLTQAEKSALLDRFYHPYRRRVEAWVRKHAGSGRVVVHLSVHTFTPVLDGRTRRGDVGLLYDPSRLPEKEFCKDWQKQLTKRRPDLLVRRNYPYLGKADGFTAYLRRRFSAETYAGIELEVNQRWIQTGRQERLRLTGDLVEAFRAALEPGCSLMGPNSPRV